jgi:hypothetical protein
MAREKPNTHPLRRFFQAKQFSELAGMNWLQDHGHVSSNCVTVDDVAERDVQQILGLAGAHWAWSDPPWHVPPQLSDYANIRAPSA